MLFVEDDERLARLTARYLESHGVVVTHVGDGRKALAQLSGQVFDAVLLDVMLPGLDGVAVCREIRTRSDLPVLMLTARVEEDDRVRGLECGADDYIPKPFSSRELLARVRSAVRRARGLAGPTQKVLEVGELKVDPAAMRATLDGKTLALTTYEFALLKALATRPGHVLSREQLLDLARGSAEEAFDRSIDVHVSRLRAKLGDDPKRPRWVVTVRGAGYMLASG